MTKDDVKEKYKDKKWLEEKYLEQDLSIYEIGKISGVSGVTIHYWLGKHGIPVGHHLDLTSSRLELLDGLMLGDGGIESESKSAYYYHGDTFQEYIQWLSQKLSEVGIENEVGKHSSGYIVWTKSYRELKDLYKEWYPTGGRKTRIPSWVEITPTTLFNWFIGDGHYSYQLFIGSTGFKEGFSKMVQQIRDLGINCSEVQVGIYIQRDSHQDFFDYILSSGFEIPPGYSHKFPIEYRGEKNYHDRY